jgi:tripartite-type tricarboxylate transporter receptor subunit TctC
MKMRNMCSLVALALICILLAAGSVPKAMAQSAADFYKGKTITLVEGFGAGSDFDVQARTISPFLKKVTGANVIAVDNKPGAAGTIARNYIFTAKPDGLTIMLDHGPRLVFNGLLEAAGVKYEWNKFIWIGKVLQEDTLIVVDKKLPWQKPQDLVGKTFVLGVSRPFYESLFAEALGWQGTRMVPGYQSPSERGIAIARGEIQASLGNSASFAGLWDTVKTIVITTKHRDYPNVPTLRESAPLDREKWVTMLEDFSKIQFSFLAPPGVPEDRVRFMEDCLRKIHGDPEFHTKVASLSLDVNPEFVGSKELKDITSRISKLNPEEVKNLKYVIEDKYIAKKQ